MRSKLPVLLLLLFLLPWSTVLPARSSSSLASVAVERSIGDDWLAERPRVADAVRLLEIWIEEQLVWQQLPGLSIGIVHDGELVWARGFGLSDLETGTPTTPSTLYRLGSVSKVITASAVMQLRDRGELDLEDPITKHLPWFSIQSPFPDAEPITVWHLLTHTAGLPRDAALPYWTDREFPTREQLQAVVPGQTLIHPPGTTYKYSNLGIALLGEIVSAVSGREYEEWIESELFAPLGMDDSSVVPSAEERERIATGYLRRMPDNSRRVFPYHDTRALAPAANLVSSVEDLAKFAALHLRQGPPEAGQPAVLEHHTLREMQRAHWVYPSWRGGRGLGFGISRHDDETVVSHGGWIGGHRTHLMLVPEHGMAVIAMLNADDGSPGDFSYPAFDTVGRAILETGAEPAEAPVVDPSWQTYLGRYTTPWAEEYRVLIQDGELVFYEHVYPPADSPAASLNPLEPVAENTFRMGDGELVVFELDDAGEVERIRRRHDYLSPLEQP